MVTGALIVGEISVAPLKVAVSPGFTGATAVSGDQLK
jgi:hypothetical protein